MKNTIFRAYDIRGRVGDELILEEVYVLGCAIAQYYRTHAPALTTLVVGRDGRTDSPYISHEIIRAFRENGISIIDIGLCATPVLSYCAQEMDAQGGLMITASHNGLEYNGIKLSLNNEPIWGGSIAEIQRLYEQRIMSSQQNPGTYRVEDGVGLYCSMLAERFAVLRGASLSCVIDCGNGATGAVIPRLITLLDLRDVICINEQVDGLFPAHKPDPTVLANMMQCAEVIQKCGARLGIGFDGDGDRMAAMTSMGRLLAGDELLVIFAQQSAHLRGPIVADFKCSDILMHYLEKSGIRVVRARSGHSIIRDALKREQGSIGGELSCHFFFNDDYYPFDDGIYAFLRLAQLCNELADGLDGLCAALPERYPLPEERISVGDQHKGAIVARCSKYLAATSATECVTFFDGVRYSDDEGWFLIRQSNTEPAITICVEGRSPESRDALKTTASLLISRAIGENAL